MSTKSKIPTDPDYIPEEIIEDILTRIPSKSLLRFKCVSKLWLSLISCPRFVKKHLKVSSNSPRVACISSTCINHGSTHSFINLEPILESINIDFLEADSNQGDPVIGSCNGLVWISYYTNNYLWNPITRILKKLAPLGVGEMDDWKCKIYEFGYNTADDDYNIVRSFIKEKQLEVDVYSLRVDSWKKYGYINDGISPYSDLCLLRGKLHICTGMETYASEIDTGTYVLKVEDIISWDLEKGVYEIVEQPDYGEAVKNLLLTKIRGWLCVVCKKKTHADLWVMKKYGVKDSWCNMLTISLSDDFPEDAPICPLSMLPSGDILVDTGGHFEVYNLKDDNKRVLESSSSVHFVYVESLVLPIQYD